MPVATPAGDLPPRPLMPYSMAGALAELAVAGCLMDLGWRGFASGAGTATAAAAAVALGCVALAGFAALGRFGPHARALLRWAAMGALAGSFASAGALISRSAGYEALMGAAVRTGTMVTAGDPTTTSFGSSIDAGWYGPEGGFPVGVTLETDELLGSGERLRCVGRVERLPDDEWGRRSFMEGKVAAVRAVHIEPERGSARAPWDAVRERVLSALEPDGDPARALIAGIVCGRTTELAAADADASFSRTGTSHLVAVSGGHLALVSALVVQLASLTRVRPAARTVVLLALMSCYVVFTGGAPSAVRSLVMVAASLLTRLGGRRGHGVSGLALAVIVLVLQQPGVVYDLGFQLSAVSVLFIHLFGGYTEAFMGQTHLPVSVASALAITLVAQLATVPITVPVFGELSLIAPIANLILGPLMTGLLICGLVVVPIVTLVPALGALLAVPLALAQLSIFVAEACAAVPYAAISVDPDSLGHAVWLPYVLAVAVYVCWKLPSMRTVALVSSACAIALAVHVIRIGWFAPPSLTVLDVGQADSILVRDGASTLLVDAGVDDAVVAALARNEVLRLDAVLITHWDRDHWGGLPAILSAYPVGRLIVAEGASDAMPGELAELNPPPISEVSVGDTLRIGLFAAEVVWPMDEVEGTENADSLVLDLTYQVDGTSLHALLTGDSEADQADRYAASVGDIDVLKLGHHGSAASTDASMLETLDPELCIASAGEGNAYGHPSDEAVKAVQSVGSAFLCTIDVGDISLEPDADGVCVRTQRQCAA